MPAILRIFSASRSLVLVRIARDGERGDAQTETHTNDHTAQAAARQRHHDKGQRDDPECEIVGNRMTIVGDVIRIRAHLVSYRVDPNRA